MQNSYTSKSGKEYNIVEVHIIILYLEHLEVHLHIILCSK